MSATITTTVRPRSRTRSLSIVLALGRKRGAKPLSVEDLPAEVLLYIIELAATPSTTLRRTTRAFSVQVVVDKDGDGNDMAVDDRMVGDQLDLALFERRRLDWKTLLSLSRVSRTLSCPANLLLYRWITLVDDHSSALFAKLIEFSASRGRVLHDNVLDTINELGCPTTPSTAFWRPTTKDHYNLPLKSVTRLVFSNPQKAHSLKPLYHISTLSNSYLSSSHHRRPSPPNPALTAITTNHEFPIPILESIRSLVIHSLHLESLSLPVSNSRGSSTPALTELILSHPISPNNYYIGATQSPVFTSLGEHLTHLRIVGHTSTRGWVSPLEVISNFGPLPRLTHLALARRASANEENDQEFVFEISRLLEQRHKLHVVATVVPDSVYLAISKGNSNDGQNRSSSEVYLTQTNLWRLLSNESFKITPTPPINNHSTLVKKPRLCVVPGLSNDDAWSRVVRGLDGGAGTGSEGFLPSSLLNPPGWSPKSPNYRDFWAWAEDYEITRRARARSVH